MDDLLKKLYEIIKKMVVGAFLLYGFNLLAAPMEILIPINVVNVIIVTLLGFPGLCCLIFMRLFIF